MFSSKYGKKGLKKRLKSQQYWNYKQEIIGVLIAAVLVFLALSFFSYSPTDNSWFYFSSKNKEIINWCGAFGAHIAAIFFFLFGSASYVLLVSLFLIVLLFFRVIPESQDPLGTTRLTQIRLQQAGLLKEGLSNIGFRAIILPVLILASSALLSLYQFDFVANNPGGVVGQLLKALSVTVFGTTGSFLLFYVLIWVSFLIFYQVSFVRFLSLMGGVVSVVGIHFARASWFGVRHTTRLSYDLMKRLGYSIAFLCVALYKLIARKRASFHKKENVPVFTKEPEEVGDSCELLSELHVLVGKPTVVLPNVRTQSVSKMGQQGNKLLHLPNTVFDASIFSNGAFERVKRSLLLRSAHAGDASIHYELPDFMQFSERIEAKKDVDAFEKKCRDRGKKLEEKLLHFGIKGRVVAIRPGPIITLFEYQPEIDSKISKIISLEDDLAMALTALSIRIIAPIPGRNVVGFEISNQIRQDVYLSDVLQEDQFTNFNGAIPLALGVDITGNSVIHDLIKMPHVLVAGSTGSGKSVGLNALLVSMLCKLRPDQLKIILIDPKRLEFAPYADIPHLLFPIVTSPSKAIPVLKWVVQEMEERYDIMAQAGARNILDYHTIYNERGVFNDEELPEMPFIVLIIDELADLMMVAGKDVETSIARIAQMARAAGIHMIVATQRPSVDVLTGMIKVNFPARVAFRVSSKVDSRTIIDSQGAEKLLGRGDMLFLNFGSSSPQRIHGAYVSTKQIIKFSEYLKNQQQVEYLDINEELRKISSNTVDDIEDELYDQIRDFVSSIDEVSISLLQRKYRIGFNRSARLIEKLERDGILAPPQGGKMRKVIR